MFYIVLIGIGLLCLFSVVFRVLLFHPFKTVYNAIVDCLKWMKFRRWREIKMGQLICFIGLFGQGKTLSAVHYVVGKYNKYNGKKIYDPNRKKWVIVAQLSRQKSKIFIMN